jgi:hypothetical protein
MTLPKYRAAQNEKMRDARVMQRIARHRLAKADPLKTILFNGHVITTKIEQVTCETCPGVFVASWTTRRHRFCPECRARRERARDAGRKR